ncbi:MAG: outer membrane lipoprotein-sorting protein [Burkholderiales bacterium]
MPNSNNILLRWLCQRLLITSVLGLWPAHGVLAQTEADAQALLVASDAVRNPPGSFSVQLTLTEFRKGQQNNRSGLLIYAKPSQSGQYNNLVRFMAPARDANKLMLRSGNDLWFYDPATKASVRISAQQRLLGQASNGDVMSTNLARDYNAQWVGEAVVKDGEGRDCSCVHLRLKSTGTHVPYPNVEYWINPRNQRPVMARFFTSEGRLLKTAYFRKFQEVLGLQRPTETVIIDGLDPDWVTLMQSTQVTPREVPDSWLQRDHLARFTGE